MKQEQRASIALICGAISHNQRFRSVFDYSKSRYCTFSINNFQSNNISVFDYDRGCYISGFLPNIFDYSTGNYVHIDRRGNKFHGYDYASCCYFIATVNGKNILFFDYEDNSYSNFVIS